MDWYDKAVIELEEEFAAGLISYADFQDALRDLNTELRGYAQEEAENRYNDIMGYN